MFYKPAGRLNQHPSYTDLAQGDTHIAELLERLPQQAMVEEWLVIVTYDENGGYWDHMPPPAGSGWSDRWGPGTRIPAIMSRLLRAAALSTRRWYDTTSSSS